MKEYPGILSLSAGTNWAISAGCGIGSGRIEKIKRTL